MCEDLLNVMPIEYELGCIERHKDGVNMENTKKDVIFVLQKSRSKVEGERKDELY